MSEQNDVKTCLARIEELRAQLKEIHALALRHVGMNKNKPDYTISQILKISEVTP